MVMFPGLAGCGLCVVRVNKQTAIGMDLKGYWPVQHGRSDHRLECTLSGTLGSQVYGIYLKCLEGSGSQCPLSGFYCDGS
jgi:hypothetical protein